MQALQLALAHLVDLVRRHVRGGRGLERPPVEFLAVRTGRDAGIVRGDLLAVPAVRCNCRSSAGAISCAGDRPRALGPIAGNALRPPLDRLDERPAFARILRGQAHLPQRLVDQERRRHEPRCARRLDAPKLAVKLLRIRLQPRQIRLGVSGVLDSMIAIEEARDVEIGADVLNDDIRRVAPAANRDVAVGKRETFERRRIGASHNLEAGAHRMREAARVEGVDALQVGAKLLRDPLLPFGGSIGELGSKRRSRAGVDAQRGRALRQQAKQIVGNPVEQRERLALVCAGRERGRCTVAPARGDQRQGGCGGERRDRFTAAKQWTRQERDSANHSLG